MNSPGSDTAASSIITLVSVILGLGNVIKLGNVIILANVAASPAALETVSINVRHSISYEATNRSADERLHPD